MPIIDFAGAKHEFGDVAFQLVDVNNVLWRWCSEFNGTRENHEISNRHIGHYFSQCAGAALILNEGIQEAPAFDTVHVGPLGFVFATENDTTIVFGLYTEDATCGEKGMVDLGQATVGARQNEIM